MWIHCQLTGRHQLAGFNWTERGYAVTYISHRPRESFTVTFEHAQIIEEFIAVLEQLLELDVAFQRIAREEEMVRNHEPVAEGEPF